MNSDPYRRKRMIEVFMSVARETQVIIATCNEELYCRHGRKSHFSQTWRRSGDTRIVRASARRA